jgi:NAD(P)H-quinone oxidoreductase subunit 5
MGFSLMVCGLGVYPAAMLHLVAHSFYKAHAFLSSGSVIDLIRGSKVVKVTKSVSSFKTILGILMALALYTSFALIWGIDLKKELSLLVIGAVIVMGLSRIFVSALSTKTNWALIFQASTLALLVTFSFFALEAGTHHVLSSQLPETTALGVGKLIAAGLILLAFGLVVFVQIIGTRLYQHPSYLALAIHVRNGFYVNALFDKLVGALQIHSSESKQVISNPIYQEAEQEPSKIMELERQLA